MPPRVSELVFTDAAPGKLGARRISLDEATQLLRNGSVLAANRRGVADGRWLLFGRTNGGRYLTLVIEATVDPTIWLVITGWDSTQVERKMLDR
jgi:hypothetical protein